MVDIACGGGGGGWECARPLNQHLLGHLLSRGGNRTFLSEGVADGNGRCVGGRGGVGGREGGAAVTCPVRLGREPSAGGTFFSFFLSLPPAAALSNILFYLGSLYKVEFRTCK